MRAVVVPALVAALLASQIAAAESPIAPDQRRGLEQTFLTFPEWFLVHSPAEYARLVADAPPHRFPFVAHVGQVWSSYATVTGEQTRRQLPANPGYHVMIAVIASSTTVEYLLRGLYENTFGRLSWGMASNLTEEDRYGARVAQDYVDFIRKQPWYLYDFGAALKGLWHDVPTLGASPLRKWERRYALSTEYLVKAGYAWLIKLGTGSMYDAALLTTQVVVDRAPATLPEHSRLIAALPDGRAVLELPRYFEFRIAATDLAKQGVTLLDIAGNTGDILVSLWAPTGTSSSRGRVLFRQPLLTMPGMERLALVLPVADLSSLLLQASQYGYTVEHVYDY